MQLLEEELHSTGGIILIDRYGKIAHRCNTMHMPVCVVSGGDVMVSPA
jgi:isoaspartyl peptidase/L-asparaginase-like protein (Ntn-hydrolase superfamily)